MSDAQFTLMAGVEIANGKVEVLSHGEADDQHSYGDPVSAANRWIGEGALWVHIADLDAAAGRGGNSALVAQTIDACRGKAHIELAGGIRDDESLTRALNTGVRRVVIDSAALADMAWVTSAVGDADDRVAVAITAHDQEIYAPGSAAHGLELAPLLEQLHSAHCRTYVVTDVDSKGVRKKSQRHVLETVLKLCRGHIVCCGSICYIQDLHALTELVPQGLSAAVADRALYTDAFTFAEAMAALVPRYDLYHWGPPQ